MNNNPPIFKKFPQKETMTLFDIYLGQLPICITKRCVSVCFADEILIDVSRRTANTFPVNIVFFDLKKRGNSIIISVSFIVFPFGGADNASLIVIKSFQPIEKAIFPGSRQLYVSVPKIEFLIPMLFAVGQARKTSVFCFEKLEKKVFVCSRVCGDEITNSVSLFQETLHKIFFCIFYISSFISEFHPVLSEPYPFGLLAKRVGPICFRKALCVCPQNQATTFSFAILCAPEP